MKKIIILLIVIPFIFQSCFKWDNWDEPDCTIYGTFFDTYTGEPLLVSQNEWQIHMWERSFNGLVGGASVRQDLRIKQDGTYQNTKFFAGMYDMIIDRGPFWYIDTLRIEVGKKTEQNFQVTPFYQIIDLKTEVGLSEFGPATNRETHPSLTVKFKVRAPLKEKNGETLPNVDYVRAFLSLTEFCGNGSDGNLGTYDNDNVEQGTAGRLRVNRSWEDEMIARFPDIDPNSNTTGEYIIGPLHVKSGYTYNVRAGANRTGNGGRWNYSEIVKVSIP